MLKTSNKIDYIIISNKSTWIAKWIKLFHENWKSYHIWPSRFQIYWNKLYIKPLIRDELGYEYHLRGFKISHDMKTNETLLTKVKKNENRKHSNNDRKNNNK